MSARNVLVGIVALCAGVTAVLASAAGVGPADATPLEPSSVAAVAAVEAEGRWTSRSVWACDRRKVVVVEGVRPDEKMPREKAQ